MYHMEVQEVNYDRILALFCTVVLRLILLAILARIQFVIVSFKKNIYIYTVSEDSHLLRKMFITLLTLSIITVHCVAQGPRATDNNIITTTDQLS